MPLFILLGAVIVIGLVYVYVSGNYQSLSHKDERQKMEFRYDRRQYDDRPEDSKVIFLSDDIEAEKARRRKK